MGIINEEKVIRLKCTMSLLAYKNALQWKIRRQKEEAEYKREYIDKLEREIAEHERTARIHEQEWIDTNEAVAKIMEPLSLHDTIELMTYLSTQVDDAYEDAMRTHRPNDVIAQLLFNGKLPDKFPATED